MALRGTLAKIDMAELEKLAAMQCTDEEIAAWFGVTTRTIERRRKRKAFREVLERGKAKGRVSVRRMQLKLLEQGNATMGVWLGKQMLGQTDYIRHDMTGAENRLVVVIPGWLPEPDMTPPDRLIEEGQVLDTEAVEDDEPST